jgi:hypothetical protein
MCPVSTRGGTRCVQSVRGEGRDVSSQYGGGVRGAHRDEGADVHDGQPAVPRLAHARPEVDEDKGEARCPDAPGGAAG